MVNRSKALGEVIDFIRVYSEALKLNSKIQDTAVSIMNKYVVKKKNLMGRSVDLWSSAAILLACKNWSIPMNAKIINDITNIQPHPSSKSDQGYLLINKTAKQISKVIELKIMVTPIQEYVDRLLGELNGFADVRNTAFEIVNEISRLTTYNEFSYIIYCKLCDK
jgi:transcription initiation factor TFIIIB Brf1 subunit/transcription initiation factor TFIIB